MVSGLSGKKKHVVARSAEKKKPSKRQINSTGLYYYLTLRITMHDSHITLDPHISHVFMLQ